MDDIIKIKQSQTAERWYLIDSSGRRIGHVATFAATLLQHKNDTFYRRNLKPTIKVVIVNSDKLDIVKRKAISKFYKNYSGYPDGLKFVSLEDQMKKDSRKVLFNAIKGMLPKNKRGADMIKNLYVYKDTEHVHKSNNPELITF